MILSLLILLFIAALLLTTIVCLLTLQLWRMLFGEAPFISTQEEKLREIIPHIPLRPGTTFYELGCGDARVMIECAKREPDAAYVGIEKNLLPYLIARWNLLRNGSPRNIILLKEDIYRADYTDADILYAYLFPSMLDRLLPKLEKELRKDSMVITPTFRFSKKQPTRSIRLTSGEKTKFLIRELHITSF